MLINDNSELSQLNNLINAEKGNKESLEQLAQILYNKNNDTSLSIFKSGSDWLLKEHGNKYPELKKGANFYKVIAANTPNLSGSALLAAKRRLYELSTGLSFAAIAGAPANQPRKSQPAKLAANEKKEALKSIIFGGWGGANGLAVTKYFASKTGANNTAFLKKYGVKPIEKYELSTGGEYTVNYQNFCFSLIANDWEKRRQPNSPNPKFRKPITQNRGKNSYIFGLAQLPATGENLIIFEGESDAICASWHKFNAIAIGGAGNKKSLDNLASELKARFKRVFVLFDNDSAGEIGGKELAQKHGFIYVDTAFCMLDFFAKKIGLDATGLQAIADCKDLCDIFNLGNIANGTNGAKNVINFLSLCTEQNNCVNPIENDRFSIGIPHAIGTPFNQYLSEKVGTNSAFNPLQTIALSIAKNKRVCLQAAAGAGKSTCLIDLLKLHIFNPKCQINKLYSEENAIKRVVITVPTTTIMHQLYTAFSGKDKDGNEIEKFDTNGNKIIAPFPNCGLLYGGTPDKEKVRFCDVIICVYDSVLLAEITDNNTLLIADEIHLLPTEFSYRAKANKDVLKAIKKARYTLSLSATPNYLFNQYFDFKLLFGVAKTTNKKYINICEYTGKEYNLIPAILSIFLEERRSGRSKGTIIIKFDDSNYLRAGAAYAKKIGLTSEVFTANEKDNPNYKSILETSKLATKVDIIFTTCLIEAGVSIKDEISHVYICDTLNSDKNIQQSARPRFDIATGINAIVNITIFVSKAANEKEKAAFKHTDSGSKFLSDKLSEATKKAALFNTGNLDFKDTSLPHDAKDYVFRDENEYIADELKILHDIVKIADKDIHLLSKRLQHTDKTIQSVTFSQIDAVENADFSECLDAIEAQNKATKNAAIDILINAANNDENNLKLLLLQLINTDKDRIKGDKLISIFELQNDKAAKKEAFKFYATLPEPNQKVLENADAKIFGFIIDIATYFKVPNTPLFDALHNAKVADKAAKKEAVSKTDTSELKERLKKVRAGKGGEIDNNQYLIDIAVFNAFKKPIENIKAKKRKPFLICELLSITNKILTQKDTPRNFKPKTETGKDGVRAYLGRYFDIETERIAGKNGKETRYTLTRKDTKKNTEK